MSGRQADRQADVEIDSISDDMLLSPHFTVIKLNREAATESVTTASINVTRTAIDT